MVIKNILTQYYITYNGYKGYSYTISYNIDW